jgi:hypothetical protein
LILKIALRRRLWCRKRILRRRNTISLNRYKEVVYQAKYEDPKVILKRLKDLEKRFWRIWMSWRGCCELASISTLGKLVDIIVWICISLKWFNQKNGVPLIRIRNILSGRTETYYEGSYDLKYLIKKAIYLLGWMEISIVSIGKVLMRC